MFNLYLEKVIHAFEHVIVIVLMAAMLFAVCFTTYIMISGMYIRLVTVDFHALIANDPDQLQAGLYRMFGNMLTILLGMELIHTIKIYFEENIVKVELIMVISIIALARHIIQLDFHHVDPVMLIGLAALMAVFIGGYLLMLKGQYKIKQLKDADNSSIES